MLSVCTVDSGQRQGVSRPLGHCPVAMETLQSGQFLYFGQMWFFESFFLSSSGRVISTDNIDRNSSCFLHSPVQTEEERSLLLVTWLPFTFAQCFVQHCLKALHVITARRTFSSTLQVRRIWMTGTKQQKVASF